MTVPNPRTRNSCRWLCAVGLGMLLSLAGCKSKTGSGGGSTEKPRDPLVYGPNRIPPQNVPLPDRGGIGVKGKSDPLLGSPTGKTGDKTGVGYSDDPERFKGTHIPGIGSTPASLAGKTKSKDGDELKITGGDDRVPLRPAGGVLAADSAGNVDALFTELEKYGVKRESRTLTRDEGKYVFRASMPWAETGANRQYTGVGETAQEAVKQVLEQVIADRK